MTETAREDVSLGWPLRIWLVLLMCGGLWVAFRIGVQIEDLISHGDPRWRSNLQWGLPSLLGTALLQALGALLLLIKRRIGLYLVVVGAAVALVLNVIIGVPLTMSAIGLIGVVITIVLVHNRWHALR